MQKEIKNSTKTALVCENTKECFNLMFQLWDEGKTVVLLDAFLPTTTMVELIRKVDCNNAIIPDSEATLAEELEKEGINTVFYREIKIPDYQIQLNKVNPESKMIVFSSGTTSSAKAIVVSVEKAIKAAKKNAGYMAVDIEGTAYIQAPLSHMWSLSSALIFLFQNRPFQFGHLMKEKKQLEELKPTIYLSVPSIIESRYLKHSSIAHYLCAGAVCSENLEKKIRNAKKNIQNFYGLSEALGVCAGSKAEGPIDLLMPIGSCSFELHDDGTWICADMLMEGYYGQEELTENVLKDGRFWVSDIFKDNHDGTYSVIGRSDSVIALDNGIKIEMESMDAQAKELISECEVCILYIDKKIVLVIETSIEDIQPRINRFNEGQPYYSRISRYVVTGFEFPKTNSGKLKRNELKQLVERML